MKTCIHHHRPLALVILMVLGSSCSIGLSDEVKSQPAENREFDWDISQASDDTDDTKKGSDTRYIFNKVRFRGSLYSQSLADEATLEAKFVVTAGSKIEIHFYEYLNSSWNKITAPKERKFHVEVTTSLDQELAKGKARCHTSCLLDKDLSQRVHNQLLTGQSCQFRFYEDLNSDSNTIRYEFSTGEHRGYGQTFRKL